MAEEKPDLELVALEENSFVAFSQMSVGIGDHAHPERQVILSWPNAQRLAAEILRRPGEWWLGDKVGTEWKCDPNGRCWQECPRKLIGGRLCSVIGVAVWEGEPCWIQLAQNRAVLMVELNELKTRLKYKADEEKKKPPAESRLTDIVPGDAVTIENVENFLKGPPGL